jgi:hypothetical protein
MRNAQRIFVVKPLEDTKRKREDNIKLNLTKQAPKTGMNIALPCPFDISNKENSHSAS